MPTIKPLSKNQRSMLGRMAADAWRKHHKSGATEEPETAWRHRESRAACGFTISEAPVRSFDALYGHFLMLQGEAGKAFDHHMGPDNEERRMRHRIAALAKDLGLRPQYAAKCQKHQLKGIIINLEKRAKAQQAIDA